MAPSGAWCAFPFLFLCAHLADSMHPCSAFAMDASIDEIINSHETVTTILIFICQAHEPWERVSYFPTVCFVAIHCGLSHEL